MGVVDPVLGMMLSQPAPTTLTFAANSTTAMLTVATVDDEVVERDVEIELEIVNPTDGRYYWDVAADLSDPAGQRHARDLGVWRQEHYLSRRR